MNELHARVLHLRAFLGEASHALATRAMHAALKSLFAAGRWNALVPGASDPTRSGSRATSPRAHNDSDLMGRLTFALGLLGLSFLSTGLPRFGRGVEAGTAVRMEIEDLVDRSPLIVEAKILSTRAFEVGPAIETELLLQVDRTFEGAHQPFRAVRVPGGVLPSGRGMMLAGMPRLAPGERCLLFLSAEGQTGIRMPVGLAQGKLALVENPVGEKVLVRPASSLSLIDDRTGEHVGPQAARVLRYADVVARIEAALARKRAR